MKTYQTSIFVELEIRVSGTLVPSDPPTHDPPYPGSAGGWEDVTVEGIVSNATRLVDGKLKLAPFDLDTGDRANLHANIVAEYRDEITEALSAEVPDGPDPDDARDRQIEARMMGDD